MTVVLKKESHKTNKTDWNYSVFQDDVLIGYCLIEVMNGEANDLLTIYDAEEEHNCYDILKRIEEIDPLKLIHKIAFIRMIEIDESFRQKGIGKAVVMLILEELDTKGYQLVILDAFKGGFLIPFYESFGFKKIPFPPHFDVTKRTPHHGENYMWKDI